MLVKYKRVIVVLNICFVLHFLIVCGFLYSGLYSISNLHGVTKKYMIPAFDQNWSMFSMPGETNRAVLYQFSLMNTKTSKVYTTEWLDVNKPLRDHNATSFFSVSQRLIKYMSSSINNVYAVAKRLADSTGKNAGANASSIDSLLIKEINPELRNKSNGYHSLRLYARTLFTKMDIPDKSSYDSVTFAVRILNDAFPRYNERKRNFYDNATHEYSSFDIDHAKLF